MKKEVVDTMKVCQFFYIMMHLLAIVLFTWTKNEIISNTLSSLFYWIVKLVSLVLFITAGRNPGYLLKSKMKDCNELQDTDWNIPSQKNCDVCLITQPYRSKHCELCEECVGKYDHHCFWIGGCVGELNHFRFTVYLIIESFSLVWTSYFCLYGETIGEKLLYGVFLLVCLGFSGLTIGLGGFHVYLISIGSTTWEISRRKSITYLKPYPYNFHPFSKNFIKNWTESATIKELTSWILPRPSPVYPFNWCDNKYWSCC